MTMKLLALVLGIALAGCPCSKGPERPGEAPTVERVLGTLAERKAKVKSFNAPETTMDYWLNGQRAKVEVLVAGMPGAKLRMNALNPVNSSVIFDLMCDGTNFVAVDHQKNCQKTGPCDGISIAQFLGLPLEPDDFFFLSLGAPPVMADATEKTIDWVDGREVVTLSGPGGTQRIALSGTGWDMLSSERKGPDGKVIWSVENKDYADVDAEDGTKMRLPGKTRFKAPQNQEADLLIEWTTVEPNKTLDEARLFTLVPPAGLPPCP
jgi:hypothetical protein